MGCSRSMMMDQEAGTATVINPSRSRDVNKTRKSSKKSSETADLIRRRNEIIEQWLEMYAAHYGYELKQEDAEAWKYALAGVHPDDLGPAFLATMKELADRDGKSVRPRAADVLGRVIPRSHGDAEVNCIIPTRKGDCYARQSPADLGLHGDVFYKCGCRDCAPQLYCQHGEGCVRIAMRNLSTGERLSWCIEHARLHDEEERQLAQAKGSFRSAIQQLADSKSMTQENKNDESEEIHIP